MKDEIEEDKIDTESTFPFITYNSAAELNERLDFFHIYFYIFQNILKINYKFSLLLMVAELTKILF
jgi:hypothetical protein